MGKDFWNRRNKKQKLRVQRSFLCLFGTECQLSKGFNIDRTREEVALSNVTAHISKLIGLDASLDTLTHGGDVQFACQFQNIAQNDAASGFQLGRGQKIAVQFEFVNGQFPQDIERRVTRTKVVHGYREAQCMQSGNDRCDFFCLIGCKALGDLDDDILGVKVILGYQSVNSF